MRNYGIDVLRIVSMLFIVVLHVLGQGGILSSCQYLSMRYELAWFLEIMAYCAVNCYALISGFVSFDTTFRWKRIVSLWIAVFFYTIGITCVYYLIDPSLVTKDVWMLCLFPISKKHYWYFTAYVGMFFFIPFLNKLVESLSLRESIQLFFTIFLLFSVYQTLNQKEVFGTGGGYSMLWLSALYSIGACIKKHQLYLRIKPLYSILFFWGCIIFTWGYKFIVEYNKFALNSRLFVSYKSPTILLAGIFLLLAFGSFSIKNKYAIALIRQLAPSTFFVYIIHVHTLVWHHLMLRQFISFVRKPILSFFFSIIGTSISIYLLCSIIDIGRRMLFSSIYHLGKRNTN